MKKIIGKVKTILKKHKAIVAVSAALFLFACISYYFSTLSPVKSVPYTRFMEMVRSNSVESVALNLEDARFSFKDINGKEYTTDNPKDVGFKKVLLESEVKVVEITRDHGSDAFLGTIIELLFSVGIIFLVFRRFGKSFPFSSGEDRISKTTKNTAKKAKVKGKDADKERNYPDVDFSMVAGHYEVKREMVRIVDFLKSPQQFTDMGARLPKGVLLFGPPGTGKTLLSKAIAGEAKVPFYNACGSDFVQMYVGVGASRIRKLFDEARANAPCIIFIDEIDAIGSKRGIDVNTERDQTINALLNEMDGFTGNEGIIVLAGTNTIDRLDGALVRPGRFDKHIAVNLPDMKDRTEILQVHAKNKRLADDINIKAIAKMTIGFSGAGLETLLNEATILAVCHGKPLVAMDEIDEAFFKVIMQGDKKTYTDRTHEENKLIAWHEAGHALVAKLRTKNEVPKVTIIPTTTGAGGVTVYTPPSMGLRSKEELYGTIMASYGGRAGEYILLGNEDQVTTGASSDILVATECIKALIAQYGMNKKYGLLNLTLLGVDNVEIIKEATALANELYLLTVKLLEENKATLKAIAEALLEKETIDDATLTEIIHKGKRGNKPI